MRTTEMTNQLLAYARTVASTEPDAELLGRYQAERDPGALDALVRRYAGLVMGVCRRRFGSAPEADDAFQTTFLLLAKNSAGIRNLPAWLHRVARLTTNKLAGKRVAPMTTEPVDGRAVPPALPAEQNELKSVIDELIAEMPERLRDVVVLCCLESLSNAEAAARLRIPVGTVCSRVHAAKRQLKAKLARRGIVGGGLLCLSAGGASAGEELIRETVRFAATFGATGAIDDPVLRSLTHEVQRSMTLAKWKLVSVAVVAVILAAFGSGPLAARQKPGELPDPKRGEQKADAGQPKSLEIVATDAATGKSVEGAVIRLFGHERPTPYVRTDARGVATAPYPPSWAALAFDIHTPDHVQQRVDVRLLDSKSNTPPERVEVKLRPGDRTLGGRLVDEQGKPVAGATVRLGGYLPKPQSPRPGVIELICDIDAVTDRDGRWKLGCIEGVPTALDVHVNHPDFLFTTVPIGPGSLNEMLAGKFTTTLKRGIEVRGRVLNEAGMPVAGATVVAGSPPVDLSPLRKTAADGSFRFASLAAGRQVLTVKAPGRSPAYRVLELATPAEVEFKLPAARTVSGRVTDQDGKPLAWASVWASFPATQSGLRLQTMTGADGRYTLADAPQEAFTLNAALNGYTYHDGSLVVAGKADCDIALTRTVKLRGTVVDAETGKPIPKFTAAHNTCGRDTSTNPPTVLPAQFGSNRHWHETQGRDGKFELELPQKHAFTMQVGVWAPGYRLARSEHFTHEGKDREFAIKLVKDTRTRVAGVVVRPDGKPAAGAIVFLANRFTTVGFRNDGVYFEGQGDRWQRCDPNGRFSFPPQDEETVVGVNHEAGWASSPALKAGDAADKLDLKLTPWAKIEGTFLLDGKPKAGERIAFRPNREWDGSAGLVVPYAAETTTDAQGRFTLDRVLPVPGVLARFVEFGKGDGHHTSIAEFTPKAGEVRSFPAARQQGRTVVGRLKLTPDLKEKIDSPNTPRYTCAGTECVAHSDRPLIPYPAEVTKAGGDGRLAWQEKWLKTPEARAYLKEYQRCPVWVGPDGRIRIEGVRADKLLLTLPLRSPSGKEREAGDLIATVTKRFEVPPMKDGWSDEPLDLGEIDVEAAKGVRTGEQMPPVAFRTLDGKDWKLSDSKGKVVVIDVWATWCGPCLAAMPKIAALHKEHGGKGLEVVGVSVDEEANTVAELVGKQKYQWRQCHVGPKSPLLEPLGVEAYPTLFVIDPEGKLLYRGHSIDTATTAIRAALGK